MVKCDENNEKHSWIVLDRIPIGAGAKYFFVCTKCLEIDAKEIKVEFGNGGGGEENK